ncbi:HEAT domain-containing protein, partial [Oryctes borbonicus]
MAIEEKLFKSLDLLRSTNEYSGDVSQRNKEKIQSCAYVTDTLTNPTTRTLPNFHHLLTNSFEILFQMCNDIESDVRLVAEESLNKIIKAMDNENTNKVLMELHKEIKRNGPARSLKSALWRFSILAGLIRLPKRKQYLISLIPCIVSISERSEDLTHEALMNSLPKILKSLGSFLSDSDVKTLLNTFLNNVGDASTVIRRASANCLLTICINCRKPYQFLSYLLDTLLELLMPIAGTMVSVFLVVGVLSCLRLLIPHIRKIEGRQEIQGSFGITKKTKAIQVGEEKFVQVYRLCVHFLLCDDDSVMSAALDTLSSLFQNCTREFKNLLLSGDGIEAGDGRCYFPTQLYNANVTLAVSKPTLPEESRKQNDRAIFSSLPDGSAAE